MACQRLPGVVQIGFCGGYASHTTGATARTTRTTRVQCDRERMTDMGTRRVMKLLFQVCRGRVLLDCTAWTRLHRRTVPGHHVRAVEGGAEHGAWSMEHRARVMTVRRRYPSRSLPLAHLC
jgi:hypothetical protein